jgi:hypothetical protein
MVSSSPLFSFDKKTFYAVPPEFSSRERGSDSRDQTLQQYTAGTWIEISVQLSNGCSKNQAHGKQNFRKSHQNNVQ